jgi:hypothetical protein
MLDADRYFVTVRPQAGGDPEIVTLDDGQTPEERHRRAYPFPARLRALSSQFVLYQSRDHDANELSLYLLDLTNPEEHGLVWTEALDLPEGQPALMSAFPRWLAGTTAFTFGIFDPDCPVEDPNCRIEVQKGRPLDGGGVAVAMATDDDVHKIDPFPYRSTLGGARMTAGIQNGPDGKIYLYSPASRLFEPDAAIELDLSQTDMVDPSGAQSFEPFVWDGDEYLVYQVMDYAAGSATGFATAYPGEIWVARIGDPVVTCRVSIEDHPEDPFHPDKQTRVDPEALVHDAGVSIYYHAGPMATSPRPTALGMRRIDLGDKSEFDAACDSGTAYPR